MTEEADSEGAHPAVARWVPHTDRQRRPAHPADDFVFRVVEYPDRPDECTIAPQAPDRDELTTAWISAKRAGSIDLGAAR